MATHDYIISNASGAAVRADLNNALAAIATNNSSATEPTTTYAYQWWADTGSSPTVMKLRNAANSAWITLFQLDGEWSLIPFENGTAAAPSIYFKDSGTDTGLFSGGTDQVNITTGGTERVEWGTSEVVFNDSGANYDFRIEGDTNANLFFVDASADAVGIGTTSPSELLSLNSSSSNAAVSIRTGGASFNSVVKFNADDTNYAGIGLENTALVMRCSNSSTPTERARIDSSGRLLVGTSTTVGANRTLQVAGIGAEFFYNAADTDAVPLILSKSRGSLGSPTIVSSGDNTGFIRFRGYDGSGYVDTARIESVVDGTPGTNDMPGRLVFSTTADGASSPTERMRIRSDGNIGFFNTPGIYPNTDNGASVGFSGNRWSAVYAVNGTIQTSDVREKIEVASSVLGSNFIKALRPVSYKWIEGGKQDSGGRDEDGNYIYKSVPGERTHWGFIAQEVKEAIDAAGVDFGGWVLTDKDDPDSQQALRYDQFIAPLTKALQEALAEIDVLKAKVAALEAS